VEVVLVKTLALANGDIVVAPGGYATLTAAPKIRQDLALALGEPLGNDRFHPEWGSVLPTYIGQPIDDETDMLVRAEVARVIEQYMSIQQRDISRDAQNGASSRYSTQDVVAGVQDIVVNVRYDTIQITVALLTQAGVRLNIKRTVNI
jgi:phage baseplate assembly protein W